MNSKEKIIQQLETYSNDITLEACLRYLVQDLLSNNELMYFNKKISEVIENRVNTLTHEYYLYEEQLMLTLRYLRKEMYIGEPTEKQRLKQIENIEKVLEDDK